MTLTLRSVKGSKLTHNEMDNNFLHFEAETLYTASTGAAFTVVLSNGTLQKLTLNSATPAITMPALEAGKSFTLLLVQDATGGRNPTFGTANFGDSTPSINTSANKMTMFSFLCDGTAWYGMQGAGGF